MVSNTSGVENELPTAIRKEKKICLALIIIGLGILVSTGLIIEVWGRKHGYFLLGLLCTGGIVFFMGLFWPANSQSST